MHESAEKLGIDVQSQARVQIGATVIDAAIDLVAAECLGVPAAEAWIAAEDTDRLKRKFRAWLAGVTWGKTYLSPTNRPSLASWDGHPWDADHIMSHSDCGLLGGEVSTASPLAVRWCGLEGDTPQDIEVASGGNVLASSFILIWSKRNPAACVGVDAAIKATPTCYYTGFHAALTKQDGAEKTGPLVAFIAKHVE